MQIEGAIIREQGQVFAVVVVKRHVVQSRHAANNAIQELMPFFEMPVVLMAQDSSGRPTFFGRPDIARFLSNVPLQRIPWRRYNIS